ncbi:hypothetical protein [Wolbachia endosymbiont (group B) of Hofmannophila pseudospretella]|uniref:hypothetical protein n=1 Tax=Wolbachia endosymbiont (group B) of Hofmannophila pseudospretella TaxID=3066177 RepID=UPI00334097CA
MPFIPLYFIYFSITSFPLLSICSLYSGNWYKKPVSATRMTPKGHLDRGYLNNTIIR